MYCLKSSFATFKKFSSENIIQGRNIFSKNDIIVSKKFLIENNLKFEDIFGKKISIKNNEEYKNNKFFKYFFNLYEYVKEVKIVGVTDSDQTDFLIHDTLRDNLFWDIHFINSNSTLLISNENFYNNLKKIHSSNNKIIPTFNNLYDSIAFKENVLKKIAIFLTSANLIITVSLILISTMLVIKSKKKEIAILKTYGKKNLNISKIFLYQNIFYILISIPFVVAISLMLNYIFNFLMKKIYINLAYDMINIFPFNYFIVIFSFVILSIVTVIISFIKVRKVEIAILKDESF